MPKFPVTACVAHTLHSAASMAFAGLARWAARAPAIAAAAASAVALSAVAAAAEDRALKLYFTHTGERATITFKRDGKFDPKGLTQINRFLRDWRRNEPARMDPRLLDLVWEVYARTGAKDYIHVVSAYRSPATNSMLRGRSRSSGVAKNSQHTLGKAMDFFIPGVQLSKLRGIAMQMQIGGVGYYPTSGSPFVHLDVGNVRAWPKMSRQELARIFPNGKTLHVPSDGRPLPGYNAAMADYKRRVTSKSIMIASTAGSSRAKGQTPAPANGLVTALLPTPKSRAAEALELQTAGPTVAGQPVFFDLAAIAIPLPTFRSSDIDPSAPLDTSGFVPTSAFAAMRGLKGAGKALQQPTVPQSSLTDRVSKQAPGGWTVSDVTLLAWALAPAERLQRLSLPGGLQTNVASANNSRRKPPAGHSLLQPKNFDMQRLASH